MVEQPILFLEKETDYPLSVFLASLNQNAVGIQSVCGLLCLLPVTFFFLYYNTELTDGLKDIAMSKTPHIQYLCGFARHGNLINHFKFIVTISSKWYN